MSAPVHSAEYVRGLQAEAERLRAELVALEAHIVSTEGRYWEACQALEKAEAAIAGVRELCANAPMGRFLHRDGPNEYVYALSVSDVLRALDGNS